MKRISCTYSRVFGNTAPKSTGTGKFVVPKTTRALKSTVVRKKGKSTKWDGTAKARLAKVRESTNARYSSVLKTLAQY